MDLSLRIIPVLAIALLSLSSPMEALAQSLVVGNCVVSTASFNDTDTVCVSGTTAGDSDSDPALACVLPSTGGTAADDVTPDGCNEFPPMSTMIDEPVWSPPTDPGTYIVVLFASDESVHSQLIAISSSAGNTAPTAMAQSVSTAEDTALPITLTGTDPESDPLTFAVVTQPGNGTLSGVAPNLTYTPDPNFNGADSFTFTASDASLTSPAATISITVNQVQSLIVGNCVVSTTSFFDDESVCVSGTTGGDSGSDPALVCVLPSTGGTAADDVTPDGCNEFPPASTMVNELVWLPPTVPGDFIVVLFASNESVLQQAIVVSSSTPTQTFNDVPTDHWAFSFIETFAASGITAGCGGGDFCPDHSVSRSQMAVFLERGMNGSDYVPPAATGNLFLDVAASDFAANFIEQLFSDGITAGCGNNNYCPDAGVSRAQMAIFLLRAKYGAGYSPPSASGVFNDVDLGYWAVHWIEKLAADGITAGCGNENYCPEATVSRAEMAVFLVRTFGLGSPE